MRIIKNYTLKHAFYHAFYYYYIPLAFMNMFLRDRTRQKCNI